MEHKHATSNNILKMKGVYCFTFPNGKRYVGYTCSKSGFAKRWQGHKNKSKYKNTKLYVAIRAHGYENIQKTILVISDSAEYCKSVEISLIDVWNLRNHDYGYNDTAGGEGANGYKHSPEAIAKISEASKGRTSSAETRAKMSVIARNRSPETRAKLSVALRNRSPETRAKLSIAQKGRKHSPETRAKLSAVQKGRKHSHETKAKMSISKKGKQKSAETKARMTAAKLAYWENKRNNKEGR